jgi:hypothetical protein
MEQFKRVWASSFTARLVLIFGILFLISALTFLGISITGMINTYHSSFSTWLPPEPLADIAIWSMCGFCILSLIFLVINVTTRRNNGRN